MSIARQIDLKLFLLGLPTHKGMHKSENELGFPSCYKFPFGAFSACARYKSVLK